jgi:serine protease inhibitor
VDAVNAHYGAGGVRNVDFAGDPEAARRIFNDWASDQTKGRIKEVLPAGSVTPDTRLILANAVYFLGEWAEPFDVSETKPADFLSAGGKVKTPMMRHDYMNKAYAAFNADGSFFATPEKVNPNAQRQTARYPGAGGFQMVELPYKGGDLSMVVLVPQSADGLAALEEKLASERLAGWMAALKSRTLNVEMPKFRVDTNYDLIPTLKSLGMTHAFDRTADFRGIASEPLFIGGVVHKAFVEVGEKGTEAAAVTAIEAAANSDRPEEMVPFIPTVRADRPFLFVIRDVKTGTVLFMGRVADPAAK